MYHNLYKLWQNVCGCRQEWNTHVAGEGNNSQTFGRSGIKKTVPRMGSSWDYFLRKIAKLLNGNNPFHGSAVWIGWVNDRCSYMKTRVFLQCYAEFLAHIHFANLSSSASVCSKAQWISLQVWVWRVSSSVWSQVFLRYCSPSHILIIIHTDEGLFLSSLFWSLL